MDKKKTDLSDVTFIIPVRIDSIDRLENVLFSTNFLLREFRTNILVWEADARNSFLLQKLINPEATHLFYEDPDAIFYRTKYINNVVRIVNTPYVAIWDADVIIKTEQIQLSVSLLRENQADFVYPYKDIMLNVPPCIKNLFFKHPEIDILEKFSSGYKRMYGNAVGGAFFANKNKYIEAGMENEHFYGWGLEDGERITRWKKLNYRITQVEGDLFHLDHSRGINSHIHNKMQNTIKLREKIRINNLPEDILKREVSIWNCLD